MYLYVIFIRLFSRTGVDAEDMLTDNGNIAMPLTRKSHRLKSGVRRAFGKLVTERFRKALIKGKYEEQVDYEDGRSVGEASQTVSTTHTPKHAGFVISDVIQISLDY